MKSELNALCSYAKEKIAVSELTKRNYISTENMAPNRGGVAEAATLPTTEFTQRYRRGDVLVSNIRPYFKKIWLAKEEGGCSNDVLVFRAADVCEPAFLYYVLADDAFFDYSTSTAKGTKMPRGDKSAIMKYEVPVFERETQRKIAAILSALDDKIELNRRVNANLEQQAAAIYSNMFVENVAPSWRQGKLAELITVKYGKDHKKLGDGIYPVFGSGGIMRYVERPLYNRESVLIPRKGTLNNVLYVDEPFWSVDTMFYTEMRLPNIAKYVYHFVKEKDLASMNAGSAVPSMTTDILNALEITIPSPDALKKFEDTVGPMFSALRENNKQNAKLAAVRDALLPRLMSGEIDVSCLNI